MGALCFIVIYELKSQGILCFIVIYELKSQGIDRLCSSFFVTDSHPQQHIYCWD
jgi:hypothetical protein